MAKTTLSDVFLVMEETTNVSEPSQVDPVKDLPKEFQKMEFVTKGNKKLGPDTWIMNMGSASDCPSAKKGYCQVCKDGVNKCYALAPELMYAPKGILESQFNSLSVDEVVKSFMKIYKPGPTPVIFKKGDFNQADVKKISDVIAKIYPQIGSKKMILVTNNSSLFQNINSFVDIKTPVELKEMKKDLKLSQKMKLYSNWGIFKKATGPRAFRERQHIEFHNLSVDKIVMDLMAKYGRAKIKPRYLRVSESGDFYGQMDVQKVSDIAEKLKGTMKVYVYTARKDLNFSNMSDNACINGSGFLVHNMFKALPEDEYNEKIKDPKELRCAGNCRICKLCINRHGRAIHVLEHGPKAAKKKKK